MHLACKFISQASCGQSDRAAPLRLVLCTAGARSLDAACVTQASLTLIVVDLQISNFSSALYCHIVCKSVIFFGCMTCQYRL